MLFLPCHRVTPLWHAKCQMRDPPWLDEHCCCVLEPGLAAALLLLPIALSLLPFQHGVYICLVWTLGHALANVELYAHPLRCVLPLYMIGAALGLCYRYILSRKQTHRGCLLVPVASSP